MKNKNTINRTVALLTAAAWEEIAENASKISHHVEVSVFPRTINGKKAWVLSIANSNTPLAAEGTAFTTEDAPLHQRMVELAQEAVADLIRNI